MRTYRLEKLEQSVIATMKCNGCGCKIDIAGGHALNCLEVKYVGGYASILGDGDRYDFDLCEPCLKLIMDTFVIPASHTSWE